MMKETFEKFVSPDIYPVHNDAIIGYLRRNYKILEISVKTQQDDLILKSCQTREIIVSNEELQAAGDAFRLEHKLSGASETFAWLKNQQITVEDWSQGIRLSLLTKKLKEHLFGQAVDNHYINNRNNYRRVALSQILVDDLTEAQKIIQALRSQKASFCALALEYSKTKNSNENGGFIGTRFLTELLPQINTAIAEAKEGEIIDPIETKAGYHVLKIEKWMVTEFNQVRENILDSLFQTWLYTSTNLDNSANIY